MLNTQRSMFNERREELVLQGMVLYFCDTSLRLGSQAIVLLFSSILLMAAGGSRIGFWKAGYGGSTPDGPLLLGCWYGLTHRTPTDQAQETMMLGARDYQATMNRGPR